MFLASVVAEITQALVRNRFVLNGWAGGFQRPDRVGFPGCCGRAPLLQTAGAKLLRHEARTHNMAL